MLRQDEAACKDWLQAASLGILSGETYYNSGVCAEVERLKK